MLKTLTFMAVTVAMTVAAPRPALQAQTGNIVETAVAAGSFTTLAKALQAAGLVDTLSGPGPFTVFAPTDEAFAKLPAGTLESLLKPENKEKLRGILLNHVVKGEVMAAQVVKLSSVKPIGGGTLAVHAQNGTVRIDGAKVIKTDVKATNGVIHVIDTVMLPKGM